MRLIVERIAGAQVDRVVTADLVRGRSCVAGEPATGGTDGRAGEPGQHGAAQHASARHRSVGFGSSLVVGHCQLAETTFCATVDRLWCNGWMTAVSFGASLACSAGV